MQQKILRNIQYYNKFNYILKVAIRLTSFQPYYQNAAFFANTSELRRVIRKRWPTFRFRVSRPKLATYFDESCTPLTSTLDTLQRKLTKFLTGMTIKFNRLPQCDS
jgi:hypothetical protein